MAHNDTSGAPPSRSGFSGWVRQDVGRFTVEVCDLDRGARVIGTGFVISADGEVVTTSAVLDAARTSEGAARRPRAVGVRLPPRNATDAFHGRKRELFRAELVTLVDDLALLKIVDPPRLHPMQVAVLGHAAGSANNPFESLLYSASTAARSAWPAGMIGDPLPASDGGESERVRLHSDDPAVDRCGGPVLDIRRDLVVGITCGVPVAAAPTGSGIDAAVLGREPIGALLRNEFPARPGPVPSPLLVAQVPDPASHPMGMCVDGESTAVASWMLELAGVPWVGREELLRAVGADADDPDVRVVSIIGLGGEGKTTAARRNVLRLLQQGDGRTQGVFWWSFYDRPSGDEFLDEALSFVFGEQAGELSAQSPTAKAAALVARIGHEQRLVFVLDGAERVQAVDGPAFGLVTDTGIRDFLAYFAAPTHSSVCLVTSRVPVHDLRSFVTHREHLLTGLTPGDGAALLQALGVRRPDDTALEQFSERVQGHALTLTLCGAVVANRHGGDPAALDRFGLSRRITQEEAVRRVLVRYDEFLSAEQRRALMAASVFRIAVPAAALKLPDPDAQRLAELRLLQQSGGDHEYAMHPIVREYYLDKLTRRGTAAFNQAHLDAREFFERRAENRQDRRLGDLEPSVEAFHHACAVEDYDTAYRLYRDIDGTRNAVSGDTGRVLTYRFGAYQKALDLVRATFPDGDVSRRSLVSDPESAAYLVNEAGLCLMSLGRLDEAVEPFRRAADSRRGRGDLEAAAIPLFNLVELHIHRGELERARRLADESIEALDRAGHRYWRGLAYRAWIDHLRGDLSAAAAGFDQASRVQRSDGLGINHLYDLWGAWHAEHLFRTDHVEAAREVTAENLSVSSADDYAEAVSQCHRVLGNLAELDGDVDAANAHYNQALRIAEQITHAQILIEALLARGRHHLRQQRSSSIDDAFTDLLRALDLAEDGHFVVFAVDARIALAELYQRADLEDLARRYGVQAYTASVESDYHWGAEGARAWAT